MVLAYGWSLIFLALFITTLTFVPFSINKMPVLLQKIAKIFSVFVSLEALSYGVALILGESVLTQISYGVSYALVIWAVIMMVVYSVIVTGLGEAFYRSKIKKINIGCVIVVLADSILTLWSVYSGKVFQFGWVVLNENTKFYGVMEVNRVYSFFHDGVWTLACVVCMILLLNKIATEPYIYKFKYASFFAGFLIVVAIDATDYHFGWKLDPKPVYFMILLALIFYYYAWYVPKTLTETLVTSSLQNMDDGIICYDIDGQYMYSNEAAKMLFEIYPDVSFEEFFAKCYEEKDLKDVFDASSWHQTCVVDGRDCYFDITYKRIKDRGRHVGFVFVLHNDTDEVRKHEIQRYRATHDPITGIYNKHKFCEEIKERLHKDRWTPYYVAVCNVNNFKMLNDVFGTKVGDHALMDIAAALKKFAFEDTLYARIQGDIFAVLVKKDSFNEDYFLSAIDSLGSLNYASGYRMRIQFGFYEVTDRKLEPEIMVDRAIIAVRSIRGNMKEWIAFYDEKLRNQALEEQEMLNTFDDALENQEFCFFIQPQIDSATKKVLGGEALVRWISPKKGVIPPGKFIEVFERSGLISKLDVYTWELACQKLQEWKKRDLKLSISVNISPKDLYYMDIYEVFTGLVKKYDISPKYLRLEITETAVINDLEKQNKLINKLREFGFYVEMDDFGSGYSSLNMLKDIIVDTLKLDMGFLRANGDTQRGRDIVHSVISMAKRLDMEVISEGVETEEQVDYLKDMGCDVFQGYYFSKPIPVSEFEQKYID